MKIGIFAHSDNETALSLFEQGKTLTSECYFYNTKSIKHAEIYLGENEITWDDQELTLLDKAIIFDTAYQDPVMPNQKMRSDWTLWQDGYLHDQQLYSFWFSLFTEMERRGVRVYNAPRQTILDFVKYDLLELLRDKGLKVPGMICTNDPEQAQAFSQAYETVVWRPVTGKAAWQLFKDKQRLYLVDHNKPPIIIAEVVKGPYQRGFLLDGDVLLNLSFKTPSQFPAEVLEQFQCVEYHHLIPVFQAISQQLDIRWAQIFTIHAAGGVYIYDVDMSPVLEQLPAAVHQKLIEMMAVHLNNGDMTKIEPLDGEYERSTIFTRRMLDILYEFEQSKYN